MPAGGGRGSVKLAKSAIQKKLTEAVFLQLLPNEKRSQWRVDARVKFTDGLPQVAQKLCIDIRPFSDAELPSLAERAARDEKMKSLPGMFENFDVSFLNLSVTAVGVSLPIPGPQQSLAMEKSRECPKCKDVEKVTEWFDLLLEPNVDIIPAIRSVLSSLSQIATKEWICACGEIFTGESVRNIKTSGALTAVSSSIYVEFSQNTYNVDKASLTVATKEEVDRCLNVCFVNGKTEY
jgi:hypothetical protein